VRAPELPASRGAELVDAPLFDLGVVGTSKVVCCGHRGREWLAMTAMRAEAGVQRVVRDAGVTVWEAGRGRALQRSRLARLASVARLDESAGIEKNRSFQLGLSIYIHPLVES